MDGSIIVHVIVGQPRVRPHHPNRVIIALERQSGERAWSTRLNRILWRTARRLRFSFTQLLLRLLRCSTPTHDLAHLDTNSLAANRWIRAMGAKICAGGV